MRDQAKKTFQGMRLEVFPVNMRRKLIISFISLFVLANFILLVSLNGLTVVVRGGTLVELIQGIRSDSEVLANLRLRNLPTDEIRGRLTMRLQTLATGSAETGHDFLDDQELVKSLTTFAGAIRAVMDSADPLQKGSDRVASIEQKALAEAKLFSANRAQKLEMTKYFLYLMAVSAIGAIGAMSMRMSAVLMRTEKRIAPLGELLLQNGQSLEGANTNTCNETAENGRSIVRICQLTDELADATAKTFATIQSTEQAAQQVSEMARQGRDLLNALTAAIGQTNSKAKEMEQVVTIINNIAFQTDILALNAAVEAARAGEHGRGFSVVADSVRSLASKTTSATKQVSELISKLSASAKEAESRVEFTQESFAQIAGCMEANVAEAAHALGASKQSGEILSELSRGIHEIELSQARINSIAQGSSSLSRELRQSSEELQRTLSILAHVVHGGIAHTGKKERPAGLMETA